MSPLHGRKTQKESTFGTIDLPIPNHTCLFQGPWEDTPDFPQKPLTKKDISSETVGEGSGVSSRSMWVRSQIIGFGATDVWYEFLANGVLLVLLGFRVDNIFDETKC